MAVRAQWKGYLKIGELSCGVSLFTATSTSQRIAFHTLNRATGHRVRRQFVDSETGKPVEPDAQVKGYKTGDNEFVTVEPEDIEAAIPESDKTLQVENFLPNAEIDSLYFDRSYYVAPSDAVSNESFILIREALKRKKVAALAHAVLFRRMRNVLLRPFDDGIVAITLSFDYEVRSETQAFSDIPDLKIKGEMLDLAKHIIDTKSGKFDPKSYEDRYEKALADLVRAKLEGKPIEKRPPPEAAKVVNLLDALRESAGLKKAHKTTKTTRRKTAAKGKASSKAPAAHRRKAS